jgi:putative ABC transport system substrate-binding protein
MTGSPEPRRPLLEAFRHGLRDLGYLEGKEIALEYRFNEGRDERLPDLAAELIRLKVDVILTSGIPPPFAAKKAADRILR